MSMKPGATMHPVASTTWPASPGRAGATAVTRSPDSATSARRPGAPVPSRTVPAADQPVERHAGALRPAGRGRRRRADGRGQGLGSSILTLFILSPAFSRSTTSMPDVTWPKTV